jgi:hypothetical protein
MGLFTLFRWREFLLCERQFDFVGVARGSIAVTDWGYPFRGEVVDAGADSVPEQYRRYQVEPRGV